MGTAIIAGRGALPGHLARALAARGAEFFVASLPGADVAAEAEAAGWPHTPFVVERLAPLMRLLEERGMGEVVFAGAATRAALDPALIDPATATLLPALMPALAQGDDATLRAVIALFEEAGFGVVGAAEIAPDLVPGPGALGRTVPSAADLADIARAAQIVAALGAADLGQGAVVAQGLCLATEALPGTDAMLRFVAQEAGGLRPDPAGARGVVFKAPKPGQDRRVDLPAIGPATVAGARQAGLAGIAFEAGGVMVLERAATVAAADAAGLFLWAQGPCGSS